MDPIRWLRSIPSRVKSSKPYREIESVLERETTIAVLMTLVAMLGMVTAYRTATAEEESSVKESKLTQSRFLELTKREELLMRAADSARFEVAKSGHLRRAKELQEHAEKIRATERGRAILLELEAQEEFVLGRIQQPYLAFTEIPGMGNKNWNINQVIDRQVSQALAESGVGSKWEENKKSIWESLEEQIGTSRKKLAYLALAVVIFVISLGFLSLAELWRHRKSLRMKTMMLGIIVCAGALAFAGQMDRTSIWYFLGCGAGFAVVWPLSKRMRGPVQRVSEALTTHLGFMTTVQVKEAEETEILHPPEPEPRLFAGARMHLEQPKSSFTCFVVLLIVLAVLLSAWVSFTYTRASIEAAKSAENAVENITTGLKNSHTTSAYFELGMLSAAQERRARLQAALQQRELARDRASGIDPREAEEILYRAGEDARVQSDEEKGDFELLDGGSGPEHDRHYPQEWVLGLTMFGPECGFALSDAANDQSLRWRNKAHWYLAAITMFAIALYLFGQSLSMGHNEEAWTLVFFGLIVVGVGIGISVTERVKWIPKTSYNAEDCSGKNAKSDDPVLRAAVQYAWGVSDLQTHDYKAAVDELKEAVEARPKFLFANLYLSEAAKNLGNPQVGEGFMNMIPEERIGEAVNHEKTALEGFRKNGLEESPVLLGNYGFDTYLYGLIKRDKALVKRGMKSTQEAIARDPAGEFLYLRYNMAVAELAMGNMTKGLEIYSETAKREGMKDAGDLVAGAVGDLEALYHYCEGLNSKEYCKEIQSKEAAITQELAAAAWPAPKTDADPSKAGGDPAKTKRGALSQPALKNPSIQVVPGGLRWEVDPVDFQIDDKNVALAVLWYTKEPNSNMWRVLGKVSGRVDSREVVQEENGRIHQFQSYLEATDQEACLPAGDYRADFYLNGVAYSAAPKPLKEPFAMKASPFKDLNLGLCRPNGWTRWRSEKWDEPVLVGGYVNDKKQPTSGIFVFDFYYPKTMWEPGRWKDLVLRAKSYLASKNIIAAGDFVSEPNSCAAELRNETMIREVSRTTGETLVARVWPAKEGIVHVAIGYNRPAGGAKASAGAGSASGGAAAADKDDPLSGEGIQCNSLRSVREIYDVVP